MPKNKIQVENNIQNNEWKTLHIFGYGETRLVTELNVQNQNDNDNGIILFNGRNYKISEKNVNTNWKQKIKLFMKIFLKVILNSKNKSNYYFIK